jgi:hypothetical protein
MPIEFTCGDCDRPIRVKDELAGKRIKCPGCSEVLTVPEEDAPPPQKKSAGLRASAGPASRRREDDDDAPPRRPTRGRKDDDEDDDAPRPRRGKARDDDEDDDEEDRPRRGSGLRAGAAPSRGRRAQDNEDDDEDRPRRGRGREEDDDEEDDRPRKKSKKKAGGSMLPLTLGIGGGVLALGGVGLLLWWLFSGGGGGGGAVNLKDWVPGNAKLVASVRLAQVWNSQHFKKSLDELKAGGMPDPEKQFEEQSGGLKISEVDRVTMFTQSMTQSEPVAIIETIAPIDQAREKASLNDLKEETHEGKKYIVGFDKNVPKGMFPGMRRKKAIHFINSKAMLSGPEDEVKKALASAGKQPAGPLHDALGLLGSGKHVVIGYTLADADTAQLKGLSLFVPAVATLLPVLEAKSGTLSLTLDNQLTIDAGLGFADAGAAGKARDAADKGIAEARTELGKLKGQLGPLLGDASGAFNELDKAMQTLKATQSGSQITLTTKMDAAPVAQLLVKSILSQGGGGKGDPFPKKDGGKGKGKGKF